jgi:translocation and assembly module TamA
MGRLDIKRGESQSYLLSALYQHTHERWVNTLSFNYLNERYNMYELPRTRANLYYPDERLTYYSTKNHMDPDTGVRLTADLSGTPAALSSKSGFARFAIGSKAVLSFLKNEQLVGRLAYGRIYINNINNLPMSLQFLIGGSQTVRGYSYQSIGPGRNMLYGTLEFRQRIWKGLYVAGFYDFGSVTDNRIFGNMQESAGPSILYRSPIGIIQISIPWRLSADHIRPRFVFSIGPEL